MSPKRVLKPRQCRLGCAAHADGSGVVARPHKGCRRVDFADCLLSAFGCPATTTTTPGAPGLATRDTRLPPTTLTPRQSRLPRGQLQPRGRTPCPS